MPIKQSSVHANVHLIDTMPSVECRVCGDKDKPDDDFVVLDADNASLLCNPRHLRKIRDVIEKWLASPDGIRLTEIETERLEAEGVVVHPPDGWHRDDNGTLRGPGEAFVYRRQWGKPEHVLSIRPPGEYRSSDDYPTERAALDAATAILAEPVEVPGCLAFRDEAFPALSTV